MRLDWRRRGGGVGLMVAWRRILRGGDALGWRRMPLRGGERLDGESRILLRGGDLGGDLGRDRIGVPRIRALLGD